MDTCTTGFQENVRINLRKPIDDGTLHRRRLYHRANRNDGDPTALKKIIEQNSSLRVNFGWSFESDYHYKIIMEECTAEVLPHYMSQAGIMTSDTTCSWIGFVPFNSYDKEEYKELSTYSLISFNNELIDFQIAVVKFVTSHRIFRQHAIMRDDAYRFDYFKSIRKDRDALADGYRFFIDSIIEICGIPAIPQELVEEYIGCHFLHQPDLFFELVEFSILKGEVGNG